VGVSGWGGRGVTANFVAQVFRRICAPSVRTRPTSHLVSEPDPRKNRKEGLGDRLGRKCTLRPECRHASDWFMIACLCAFIGNTNPNPLVQFKETENKQDLLAREVAGALISSHWAHKWLEVPEIKWIRTITNSIHSAWYTSTPAYLPDPPSDFPRVWFQDYLTLTLHDKDAHTRKLHIILLAVVSLTQLHNSWEFSHQSQPTSFWSCCLSVSG